MKDRFEAAVNSAGMPRRDFLRSSLLVTLPLMLAGIGLPRGAAAAVYVPPTRQRGSTVRSVKNYGAVGNGSHDDTSAFQNAINSLPATGGTVFVPAGTYLIDAIRSVKLRSLMHLQLDPNAKLIAKPNSADSYNVVLADVIHDVEISGGQIVGERDQHRGTTGEWGHGIRIRGSSRVTIRDILISKGWGDGITVGPRPVFGKTFIYSTDVAIANVVCTGNRRNGMSIGNVIGIKVYDSEFSNTNGTSPQCGIDVEPDHDVDGSGHADGIWIENCLLRGNAHYGFNVWNRTRNLTVTKCTVENNGTCGLVTRGLTASNFIGNTIRNNMSTGLFLQIGSAGIVVKDNTSYRNYLKQGTVSRQPFTLTGVVNTIKKDLIVGDGTSNIHVGANHYK